MNPLPSYGGSFIDPSCVQAWCKSREFDDGNLVYEDKLALFLQEEILDRPLRTKRAGQAQTTKYGVPIVHTLSARTVKTYAAALISLYYTQKSLGINHHPHPRGTKIKNLLMDRSHYEYVRRKTEFHDRGVATLQDGYSPAEFIRIVRSCWTIAESLSALMNHFIEAYFRTIVDFLLSHNMLLKGENRREIKLTDRFTIDLPQASPTKCVAMMVLLGNGKTNYLGKREYDVVLRHRNPFLCSLTHTAFYLFYR